MSLLAVCMVAKIYLKTHDMEDYQYPTDMYKDNTFRELDTRHGHFVSYAEMVQRDLPSVEEILTAKPDLNNLTFTAEEIHLLINYTHSENLTNKLLLKRAVLQMTYRDAIRNLGNNALFNELKTLKTALDAQRKIEMEKLNVK